MAVTYDETHPRSPSRWPRKTDHAGAKVELWRCPLHEWQADYHWSPGACDFKPHCPAIVGHDETCDLVMEGPYRAEVR